MRLGRSVVLGIKGLCYMLRRLVCILKSLGNYQRVLGWGGKAPDFYVGKKTGGGVEDAWKWGDWSS